MVIYIFAILTICASLFFAEFLLNSILPGKYLSLFRSNKTIGLKGYLPLIDITVFPSNRYIKKNNVKNLVQKKYRFRTDSSGFIVPSKIHNNPDLTFAFLGGSMTECLFVEEKNRFPYLSTRLIEKNIEKKINLLNLSVGGTNSRDGINTLINVLLNEAPDYIIFMYNTTDLISLCNDSSYMYSLKSKIIYDTTNISVLNLVLAYIRKLVPNIYHLTRQLYKKIINFKRTQTTTDFAPEKIIDSYKRNLKTFISICKVWNIEPILLTQPNRYIDNMPKSPTFLPKGINCIDFIQTHSKMNDIIREIALDNNIALVDLDCTIPKNSTHLYDSIHLNDNGSILAAKKIADDLCDYIIKSNKIKIP